MKATKPIRRSQLISPWGIGQMINFPKDESLMVVGLDLWEEQFSRLSEPDEFIIEEERLAKRLNVKNFRLPPDYREPQKGQHVSNASLKIPFVRFPKWHYCTRCGYMEKSSIFSSKKPTCQGIDFNNGRSCKDIPANKRQKLIPVRFVAICKLGHIQDFPFMEWVHKNTTYDENHKLRLRAGRSSSSLSGIDISCSCGAHKTMAGAFNEESLSKINVTCTGDRPWLGEEFARGNAKHCGQNLIVVQKGASNVYFSQVRSSIYLPQWEKSVDRKLVEVLEKNWSFLTSGMENGGFQEMRFELVAERNFALEKKEYFTNLLLSAAAKRLSGDDVPNLDSEEKYRNMEYDAILSESGGENQDFFVTKCLSNEYIKNESDNNVCKGFSSIGLMHKLRETRAFVGFSRWLPDDGKNLEDRKNFIKLGNNITWLPAIVIRGEGVFFEFNQTKIKSWAQQPQIKERITILSNNYNNERIKRGREVRNITPEFVLIHTFAHLVINQFSFECGYGSSSLRERIYCNQDSLNDIMNGVLIYTASGDSEGSLGGLVRQGKPGNLESIVDNAVENARWCSSDPICIDSNGQGPNSCNLAACHNCALLPETCCEESNMLLDRAMLIGTLDLPNIGYFNM